MTLLPDHFKIDFSPIAHPDAVVVNENVRFTVLHDGIIRMEYARDNQFEDRPSQAFWYRHQPVPTFEKQISPHQIVIRTARLELTYSINAMGFKPNNLSIKLLNNDTIWHYGDEQTGNLGGTARTLDNATGDIPLDMGLLSRDGWVLIDDSQSLVFTEDMWLDVRPNRDDKQDLYFFGFGQDYQACLDAYAALTGKIPMLPRWALGNWWSRYWRYSDQELRDLMMNFKEHDVPLSVCIVDMDWHLTEIDKIDWASGWTGYTWDLDVFPDPQAFIQFLHDHHIKTALNLHPHAGVEPHEAMYEAMARRMGIDPATKKPVKFDIADPEFTKAYFELLHHPHEDIGIDFWWIDWQQGEKTRLEGLDPLWWLNHLHFYDLGRDGKKRPFIFSRWGGLGNHRYPIGFSGDTTITWDSLDFQPYFTATAANVGYAWWSHDIGGHMKGIESPEIYTRWVQYGIFSPIMRLHSTKNAFHERRPWGYDQETFTNTRDAMQLRHALIPYLYTLSWQAYQHNRQPIRPLYHDYPTADDAYACPQAYTFGPDMIVAPFTEPMNPETRLSRQVVWLPEGDWYHFNDGTLYEEGWHAIYGTIRDIPAFARAGAIIPLDQRRGWAPTDNPTAFELRCYAGADGEFTLYEDDGETRNFMQGAYAETSFKQNWRSDRLEITITPATGDLSVIPAERTYELVIFGVTSDATITATLDGKTIEIPATYDLDRKSLRLQLPPIATKAGASIILTAPQLSDRPPYRLSAAHKIIQHLSVDTFVQAGLTENLNAIVSDPQALMRYKMVMTDAQLRALIETLHGVGYHITRKRGADVRIVIWNNTEQAGFTYQYGLSDPSMWLDSERYIAEFGTAPRFKAFEPQTISQSGEPNLWRIHVNYFDIAEGDERVS